MNRKSYTIENLVTHMARHSANRKSGAWYNVPVALDKVCTVYSNMSKYDQ